MTEAPLVAMTVRCALVALHHGKAFLAIEILQQLVETLETKCTATK